MRLLRNVLAVIFFIGSVVFFFMTILTFVEPSFEGKGLAICLTIFFLLAGLLLRTKSKGRVVYEKDRQERGILESSTVHHLEGLRIAEKTKCTVTIFEDKLTLVGGGVTFNLSTSQITAAEIKTDVEIANVVHSSAAKGIAGGLVFGPIGLVVGSRATNKEKRTIKYYFLINYVNSSGEVAAILFQDDITPHLTKKLVEQLRPLINVNEPTSVQL